jgi:hypothetical protein
MPLLLTRIVPNDAECAVFTTGVEDPEPVFEAEPVGWVVPDPDEVGDELHAAATSATAPTALSAPAPRGKRRRPCCRPMVGLSRAGTSVTLVGDAL